MTCSPGKKNIFMTNVNNIIHLRGFNPFNIYLNGMLDSFIIANKDTITNKYGQNLLIINSDTININVPTSFTLESNLCIRDCVG